ncbi:hypothetical protein AB0D04_19370 [Streptomyces sp. NPDC048483]|uniref:hypothetical protein n=1 Tax=Streptomyces sp. NPDC048483 TaxID=3154927 RepID=UPI003449EC19
MPALRRSVIRTAAVAAGALAVLVLPAGSASAAGSPAHAGSRAEIMLPDNGLAGVAEKIDHLPKATRIGGAGALGAAGVGIAVLRRRHDGHPVRTAGARRQGRAQRA